MIFRKLSEVAPPSTSRAKPAPNDTVWHLTLDQIESGSGQIISRVSGRASAAGLSTFAFDTGNVLYSKLRPYLNKVVCPDASGIATTELVPLRPVPGELIREYLCSYLRSPQFVSWANTQVDGAKMPRMKMKPFWAHEIPLPPLNDQIRIAYLLRKVEGLITQRKQHLQQLDELIKSVFLEMFGDPVRNEKGWEIQPGEKAVLDISSGTSYGGEDRAFVSPDEVGVLKISAVTKGTFDPTEFKVVNQAQITKTLRFVKRGDFLFSRANTLELVAACCVVPRDYTRLFLPDKLWVLTLNSQLVNSQFFNYLLKNDRYRDVIRNLASGGHDSMLNISMKKFMKLSIPCPLMDLQNQFALIVERVDGIKSHYQQSLNDLEDLYGVLSQKAFKGSLDLSRVPLLEEQALRVNGEHDESQEQSEQSHQPIGMIPPTEVINHLVQAVPQQGRSELLARWFSQYLTNSSRDISLGSAQLLESAWQTLHKEQFEREGETPALTLDDYDALKDQVFKKLASSELSQTFDGGSNRVALKKPSADWGAW